VPGVVRCGVPYAHIPARVQNSPPPCPARGRSMISSALVCRLAIWSMIRSRMIFVVNAEWLRPYGPPDRDAPNPYESRPWSPGGGGCCHPRSIEPRLAWNLMDEYLKRLFN